MPNPSITTKPFQSRRQWRWAFATGQPFARRWAHETPGGEMKRYRKLPKIKRKAASACTCTTKGEQIAPGITRIRGNLCNVHGRYGPCDANAMPGKVSAGRLHIPRAKPSKPKKAGGKKGGKKGGVAKPKKTEQEREQERQAKQQERDRLRAEKRTQNRADTLRSLNIAPDGQEALEALRRGEQPDPAALARAGFIAAGLVEQSADGSYRMTPSGRALLSAADAGDRGRAGDIIGGARGRASARTQRQTAAEQRKRDAEAKRVEREEERKKRAEEATRRRSSSGGTRRQTEHAPAPAPREVARPPTPRETERAPRTVAPTPRREPTRAETSPAPAREPERARPAKRRAPIRLPLKKGGRRQIVNEGTRAKAITYKRSNAELRAMFAKMGGGGGGGGGSGKGGAAGAAGAAGESKLWPKDPKTGRREDPALFGASYQARQTDVRSRAAARDRSRAEQERSREDFFKRQSEARTTTAPTGPKIAAQSAPRVTPNAQTGGISKPERYRELEQATERVKMPQAGWNQASSDKQRGYLSSLTDRARQNTKEGTPQRALADEIAKATKAGTLTKWEASQLIDAMQQPKPMSTLLEQARQGIRAGGETDRWRALLALPSFRASLIGRTLNDEATAEGLAF